MPVQLEQRGPAIGGPAVDGATSAAAVERAVLRAASRAALEMTATADAPTAVLILSLLYKMALLSLEDFKVKVSVFENFVSSIMIDEMDEHEKMVNNDVESDCKTDCKCTLNLFASLASRSPYEEKQCCHLLNTSAVRAFRQDT